MNAWLSVGLAAGLALVVVYAYAALALVAHSRLNTRAPPRTLSEALLVGALVPACGCTALPYARRAAPEHRAPFLVAAYAANPVFVIAAWLVAGPLAAAALVALALTAAQAAARLPAPATGAARVRLDDLLLKRDARPWLDAAPYLRSYAMPALVIGGLLGGARLLPPLVPALAISALALFLGPPESELAIDNGAPFARAVRRTHIAFAIAAGAVVGVIAWL